MSASEPSASARSPSFCAPASRARSSHGAPPTSRAGRSAPPTVTVKSLPPLTTWKFVTIRPARASTTTPEPLASLRPTRDVTRTMPGAAALTISVTEARAGGVIATAASREGEDRNAHGEQQRDRRERGRAPRAAGQVTHAPAPRGRVLVLVLVGEALREPRVGGDVAARGR